MAYLDVVGFLPAPAATVTSQAADILEQSAFAYAACSSIVVLEVHRLHVTCTLHGGHKANITAIKWCPAYLSRDLKSPSHLRLASGDADGNVVVWDVLSASPIARLEDLPPARDVLREYSLKAGSLDSTNSSSAMGLAGASSSAAGAGGITSLAWVMPLMNVLAVVVSPALLLLWDVTTGGLLWWRELGSGSELFSQLAVDPLDSRQLCLCGSSGALTVLQLRDPAADRVDLKQYRINTQAAAGENSVKSPSSGTSSNSASNTGVQALFTVSRGLLLLLLPRELLLFDLKLGAPAASTPLPAGRPPFSYLLGVFGGGVCQGGGDEGGIDYAYCLHSDGGLSVWVRVPGELRFRLGNSSRLMPPPLRGAGNQASVVVIRAALWRHQQSEEGGQAASGAQTAASTAAITSQISSSLAALTGSRESVAASKGASAGAGAAQAAARHDAATLSGDFLLVVAVSADGRVWQWEAAMPRYLRRSFLAPSEERPINLLSCWQASKGAAPPLTVVPQLVGLLHGLPSGITSLSMQSRPLLLPAYSRRLAAAGTKGGGSSSSSRPPRSQQQQDSEQLPFLDDQLGSSAAGAAAAAGAGAAAAAGAGGGAAGAHVGSSQGDGAGMPAECATLGCAGTSSGHLSVFLLRRGLVDPLAVEVVSSQALLKDGLRAVCWLGCSPLVVAFGSEKSSSSGGWRNTCILTDVRTGGSLPFRDSVTSELSPLIGIRASRSGAYLLLLFKGAPAELWSTRQTGGSSSSSSSSSSSTSAGGAVEQPGLSKPWRVRLVDLPFSAVEWVDTEEELQKGCFSSWTHFPASDADADDDDAGDAAASTDPAVAAAAHAADRDSLTAPSFNLDRQLSMWASRTLSLSMGRRSTAAAAAGSAGVVDNDLPQEMLAFALVDGRSGVLSVKGRKVTDMRPVRPSSGPGPGDLVATALCAVWPLLMLGGADGQLMAWDLTTGRCSSLATGQGMVRRIQLAPGAPPALTGTVEAALIGSAAAAATAGPPGRKGTSTSSSGVERMRAAVLFAGGAFAVYELDAAGRLRSSPVSTNMSGRVGHAQDMSWVALPGAAGSGSVLSVVLEDGSLSLLDVAQPAARRPGFRARQQLLRQVLAKPCPASLAGRTDSSGSSSSSNSKVPLMLLGPRPLGSSMMLPQPWVLLLRFLLQAGVSHNTLLYLSSSSTDEDDEVREELLQLLPASARSVLLHMAAAASVATGSRLMQVQSADVSGGLRSTGPAAAAAAVATGMPAGSLSSGDAGMLLKTQSSPVVLLKSRLSGVTSPAAAAVPEASSSARALMSSQQQQQLQRLPSLPSGSDLLGFDFDQGFDGDLVKLLRRMAQLRGSGQLLHADEWRSYTQALCSGQVAGRMAVAARLSGLQEECRFWTHLPATLANIKTLHTAIQAAQQEQQQSKQGVSAAMPTMQQAPAAASSRVAEQQRDTAAATDRQPGITLNSSATASAAASGPADAVGDKDVSDYDLMVQQALQAPAANATEAAGGNMASVLPRRGSLGAVPGHVRCTGPEQFSDKGAIKQAAADRAVRLWDEELVLADAQERLLWHEALPAQVFEAQDMLELRLLEYVVLGDFATAVAFLLSTPPESSVNYYRSIVCALALAASASLRAQSQGNSSSSLTRSATLHLQAAKVVSAHAASIGDNLLGVPLNCSAGLNAEAVTVLQEAGLWQLAANLVARTLSGTERAQALSRWAGHVLQQEGSLWRCVGLLTSAGCLAAAAQVLRGAGLPDCAQAFVSACQQAGLQVPAQPVGTAADAVMHASDAGVDSDGSSGAASGASSGQGKVALELFDLLGQRSRMLPYTLPGTAVLTASSADDLALINTEYHTFLCTLLANL